MSRWVASPRAPGEPGTASILRRNRSRASISLRGVRPDDEVISVHLPSRWILRGSRAIRRVIDPGALHGRPTSCRSRISPVIRPAWGGEVQGSSSLGVEACHRAQSDADQDIDEIELFAGVDTPRFANRVRSSARYSLSSARRQEQLATVHRIEKRSSASGIGAKPCTRQAPFTVRIRMEQTFSNHASPLVAGAIAPVGFERSRAGRTKVCIRPVHIPIAVDGIERIGTSHAAFRCVWGKQNHRSERFLRGESHGFLSARGRSGPMSTQTDFARSAGTDDIDELEPSQNSGLRGVFY